MSRVLAPCVLTQRAEIKRHNHGSDCARHLGILASVMLVLVQAVPISLELAALEAALRQVDSHSITTKTLFYVALSCTSEYKNVEYIINRVPKGRNTQHDSKVQIQRHCNKRPNDCCNGRR